MYPHYMKSSCVDKVRILRIFFEKLTNTKSDWLHVKERFITKPSENPFLGLKIGLGNGLIQIGWGKKTRKTAERNS